jgi:hypothetical protein
MPKARKVPKKARKTAKGKAAKKPARPKAKQAAEISKSKKSRKPERKKAPARKPTSKAPAKKPAKAAPPKIPAKAPAPRPAGKQPLITPSPGKAMISATPGPLMLPAPEKQAKPALPPAGSALPRLPAPSEPPPITPIMPATAGKLFDHRKDEGGALAVEIKPALEMLPGWEDRGRLRRVIFEEGLTFFALSRTSPEFAAALSLLSPSSRPMIEAPGHFMVCVKGRDGSIIGAMDGHSLSDSILSIDRCCVRGERRRELHILLYGAALAGKKPLYVVCTAAREALSMDSAGRFILFGRGFGMSAMPLPRARLVFLVRRVGKEPDPMSSGEEIASLLRAMGPLGFGDMGALAAEFDKKGPLALIPLPSSPDSREHLHELRDAVAQLGLPADNLEEVLAGLRSGYVLGRADITPELI